MPEAAEPRQAHLRLDTSPSFEGDAPPSVYSNFVQATFVPENFTLHFGAYTAPPIDSPPDEIIDIPVSPVARVVIPLNLMRNFIALLQRQVEEYEANFGEIPEHPNKPSWLREQEGGPDG